MFLAYGFIIQRYRQDFAVKASMRLSVLQYVTVTATKGFKHSKNRSVSGSHETVRIELRNTKYTKYYVEIPNIGDDKHLNILKYS